MAPVPGDTVKYWLDHGELVEISSWDVFKAFLGAINWTEPFIVGLIVFHLLCLLVVVLLRRRFFELGVLWLFLSAYGITPESVLLLVILCFS